METIINKLPEDINYMFYIKPKGVKRFSTYNPGKGTMGTGRVFTELYRKEHLSAVCKWIAEDNSGNFAYQLRSGDGKKIYWEHNPIATRAVETPQISMETAETVNVSAEGENAAERKEIGVQTIADMVAIGENLNKGESVSFKLHLHFLWSVTITNESAEWREEFKYSLNAKCLDNPQSFGRRYTSFGLAMLHCLNQFNENANIRDDYETLSAALNKPQNLISDFRAPQSPEAPQMTECIDEPCKLAQTA